MENNSEIPITIVIFGASGDLTQRKLVPALFSLYRKGRLPTGTRLVGYARTPYAHDDFRAQLRAGVEQFAPEVFNAADWEAFAARLWYVHGDYSGSPADYERLHAFLREMEGRPAHRLYYLATPPTLYEPVVAHLGAASMAHPASDPTGRRQPEEGPW